MTGALRIPMSIVYTKKRCLHLSRKLKFQSGYSDHCNIIRSKVPEQNPLRLS